MPKVGSRRFPYTPQGEAAAEEYAKRVGKPVKRAKPKPKPKRSKK